MSLLRALWKRRSGGGGAAALLLAGLIFCMAGSARGATPISTNTPAYNDDPDSGLIEVKLELHADVLQTLSNGIGLLGLAGDLLNNATNPAGLLSALLAHNGLITLNITAGGAPVALGGETPANVIKGLLAGAANSQFGSNKNISVDLDLNLLEALGDLPVLGLLTTALNTANNLNLGGPIVPGLNINNLLNLDLPEINVGLGGGDGGVGGGGLALLDVLEILGTPGDVNGGKVGDIFIGGSGADIATTVSEGKLTVGGNTVLADDTVVSGGTLKLIENAVLDGTYNQTGGTLWMNTSTIAGWQIDDGELTAGTLILDFVQAGMLQLTIASSGTYNIQTRNGNTFKLFGDAGGEEQGGDTDITIDDGGEFEGDIHDGGKLTNNGGDADIGNFDGGAYEMRTGTTAINGYSGGSYLQTGGNLKIGSNIRVADGSTFDVRAGTVTNTSGKDYALEGWTITRWVQGGVAQTVDISGDPDSAVAIDSFNVNGEFILSGNAQLNSITLNTNGRLTYDGSHMLDGKLTMNGGVFNFKSDTRRDTERYTSDSSGTRFRIGLGGTLALTEKLSLFLEAAYEKGSDFKDINGNFGINFSW